jgi:hypothetical protein
LAHGVPRPIDATGALHKPFYLILNIAVGGHWGDSQGVDLDIYPQRMVVDYVRVYETR